MDYFCDICASQINMQRKIGKIASTLLHYIFLQILT